LSSLFSNIRLINRDSSPTSLHAAIHVRMANKSRVFHEVSIRQEATVTPTGFADCWHLDIVALESQRKSSKHPYKIDAFEIKSCRADFQSDSKWKKYLSRVDSLTFVCLPGVMSVNDVVGSHVGLWEVEPSIHKAWDNDRKYYSASWNEIQTVGWSFDMPLLNRFDLMYGLAINKRADIEWSERFQEYANLLYSQPASTKGSEK